MTHLDETPTDARAEHSTHLLSNLDGVLDVRTLDALQGVWSALEHAASNGESHARAVRERLFWHSLAPAGTLAAPLRLVEDEFAPFEWSDEDAEPELRAA